MCFYDSIFLQVIFDTFTIYINCVHPNTLDAMVLCFGYSLPYIYLPLTIDKLCDIPPPIPFSAICIISILVCNSNSISVSSKSRFHANLGTDKK